MWPSITAPSAYDCAALSTLFSSGGLSQARCYPHGPLFGGALCSSGGSHAVDKALFTDIRSAYYSIIRQYVTGFCGPDDAFLAIIAGLSLSVEIAAATLAFIHEFSSLLEVGGVDPTVLPSFKTSTNQRGSLLTGRRKWFKLAGAHLQGIPPRT